MRPGRRVLAGLSLAALVSACGTQEPSETTVALTVPAATAPVATEPVATAPVATTGEDGTQPDTPGDTTVPGATTDAAGTTATTVLAQQALIYGRLTVETESGSSAAFPATGQISRVLEPVVGTEVTTDLLVNQPYDNASAFAQAAAQGGGGTWQLYYRSADAQGAQICDLELLIGLAGDGQGTDPMFRAVLGELVPAGVTPSELPGTAAGSQTANWIASGSTQRTAVNVGAQGNGVVAAWASCNTLDPIPLVATVATNVIYQVQLFAQTTAG